MTARRRHDWRPLSRVVWKRGRPYHRPPARLRVVHKPLTEGDRLAVLDRLLGVAWHSRWVDELRAAATDSEAADLARKRWSMSGYAEPDGLRYHCDRAGVHVQIRGRHGTITWREVAARARGQPRQARLEL